MEPPVSSPRDVAHRNAAVAAPEPLLDVPGFLEVSPGITRGAMRMMEYLRHGILAHVQLAQEHRSRGLEVGHDRGVLVGDEIGQYAGACRRPNALGPELVFHRDG